MPIEHKIIKAIALASANNVTNPVLQLTVEQGFEFLVTLNRTCVLLAYRDVYDEETITRIIHEEDRESMVFFFTRYKHFNIPIKIVEQSFPIVTEAHLIRPTTSTSISELHRLATKQAEEIMNVVDHNEADNWLLEHGTGARAIELRRRKASNNAD